MKTKTSWILLALIALMAYISSAHAEEKVIKLSFAQITPAAHPYYSAISDPWAKEIEKRTDGRGSRFILSEHLHAAMSCIVASSMELRILEPVHLDGRQVDTQ